MLWMAINKINIKSRYLIGRCVTIGLLKSMETYAACTGPDQSSKARVAHSLQAIVDGWMPCRLDALLL